MKIPFTYLAEKSGDTVKYPKYGYDTTIMFSMLELAGNDRVKNIVDLFYLNRMKNIKKFW